MHLNGNLHDDGEQILVLKQITCEHMKQHFEGGARGNVSQKKMNKNVQIISGDHYIINGRNISRVTKYTPSKIPQYFTHHHYQLFQILSKLPNKRKI